MNRTEQLQQRMADIGAPREPEIITTLKDDLRALHAMQVAAESLSVPSGIRYEASAE